MLLGPFLVSNSFVI